ncbi:MAG: hypothetical protein AAB536_01225 [Patescibacteria group bacterium]
MTSFNNKENIGFWSAIGLVFAFVVLSWFGDLLRQAISPEFATAATSSAVNVNASVAVSISCSVSTTTTLFGTLTGISTSTPQVSSTMACSNSSLGCTLSINDTGSSTTGGGLYSSSSNSLIESPNAAFNASATLAAGTEGYGVQSATTTIGAGAQFSMGPRYNYATTTLIFGGLTTTTQILASTSATTSAREIIVTHGAAIASSTPGATYVDTITYSCLAN